MDKKTFCRSVRFLMDAYEVNHSYTCWKYFYYDDCFERDVVSILNRRDDYEELYKLVRDNIDGDLFTEEFKTKFQSMDEKFQERLIENNDRIKKEIYCRLDKYHQKDKWKPTVKNLVLGTIMFSPFVGTILVGGYSSFFSDSKANINSKMLISDNLTYKYVTYEDGDIANQYEVGGYKIIDDELYCNDEEVEEEKSTLTHYSKWEKVSNGYERIRSDYEFDDVVLDKMIDATKTDDIELYSDLLTEVKVGDPIVEFSPVKPDNINQQIIFQHKSINYDFASISEEYRHSVRNPFLVGLGILGMGVLIEGLWFLLVALATVGGDGLESFIIRDDYVNKIKEDRKKLKDDYNEDYVFVKNRSVNKKDD